MLERNSIIKRGKIRKGKYGYVGGSNFLDVKYEWPYEIGCIVDIMSSDVYLVVYLERFSINIKVKIKEEKYILTNEEAYNFLSMVLGEIANNCDYYMAIYNCPYCEISSNYIK